jgi:hypothetical protein
MTKRILTLSFALLFIVPALYAQGNKPVALVKGEVTDQSGTKLADVQVSAYKGGERINSVKTSKEGKFQVILQPSADYIIQFSHPDYYFQEERISVPALEKFQEMPVNARLRPLELNKPYDFSAMIFEPSTSSISPAASEELENLVNLVKRNKLSLRVTVFPDQTPSGANANKQNDLAEARKSAITSYFASKNLSGGSFNVTINNSPGPGKFERMITETVETPPKKKTGKPTVKTTTRKALVPQYIEVVLSKS